VVVNLIDNFGKKNMNKYTKDAVIGYLIAIIISVSTAGFLALSATMFGIEKVLTGLGIAVFLFCSYKYIKIQSEINRCLDELKKK
jgi:ABC-type uncharacterized transport system permease subunit